MKTDLQILEQVHDWGHFYSPAALAIGHVRRNELAVFKLDSPVAKAALASLQRFMAADMQPLVYKHHRRALVPDGAVGPATRELASSPRCPFPDYAPPPGASFHYDDPDLQTSVERYQQWKATGSGSWPAGCKGRAGIHEITISFDTSLMPSAVRPWWDEIKARLIAGCAAVGILLIEVPVGQSANIRMSWRGLAGSTIGLAEFNNGTCGDSVFCYLDPGFAPSLVMVLILLMHEVGHNLNFEHSGTDAEGNYFIMHPSIRNVPPHWVQRDNAGKITYRDIRYAKAKEFFGGEPIAPPVPPPPPAPGPTPIPIPASGELFMDGNGVRTRYLVVPTI